MSVLLKALPALALALAPVPAVPQTVQPESAIPKVLCPIDSEHGFSGTAFRIGPHLLLSVKHVTTLPNCMINGVPIHVIYTSAKADFSILTDDRAGQWLKVDCGGFVAGREYIAIGHPRGTDGLVAVPMIATGRTEDGEAVLVGIFTAQPGHSGGAIIDAETGKVVGTINAADWEHGMTDSVELKNTPVCGGDLA